MAHPLQIEFESALYYVIAASSKHHINWSRRSASRGLNQTLLPEELAMYMGIRAPRVPVFCGCLRFERIGRQEMDLGKPDLNRY